MKKSIFLENLQTYIQDSYFPTMKVVIDLFLSLHPVYSPHVPVEHNASASEVVRRKRVLETVDFKTGEAIERRVLQKAVQAYMFFCRRTLKTSYLKPITSKKF